MRHDNFDIGDVLTLSSPRGHGVENGHVAFLSNVGNDILEITLQSPLPAGQYVISYTPLQQQYHLLCRCLQEQHFGLLLDRDTGQNSPQRSPMVPLDMLGRVWQHYTMEPSQAAALLGSMRHTVSAVVGLAGSGKSHTTMGPMLANFLEGRRVLIACPTNILATASCCKWLEEWIQAMDLPTPTVVRVYMLRQRVDSHMLRQHGMANEDIGAHAWAKPLECEVQDVI